ncbi:MAG TPA: DNA-directed RNA polymerase subunit D [Geobacterales bacterium]|nr:DNA-directed RNA polymerase subunit D [Geobacterales bacterium]
MDVEILNKNELTMELKVSGISPQFMNLLRRVLIARVPTIAIDDVIIVENSSIMYDEMLAHRLGLIPIKADILNLKEDTIAYFKCEVSAEYGDRVVYSRDLVSSDPNIVPAYDTIPICKLARGQKLSFEAIARVKYGYQHARFQPVSACAYKQLEDGETFIFRFDSTGISEPEKILQKGLEVILNTYDDLLKSMISKLKE